MTQLDDETIKHLSGGKISRMPAPPSRPTAAIDPYELAKAVQLSGTNRVYRTQRGAGWDPLPPPPPEDTFDWSAEALRRRGEA